MERYNDVYPVEKEHNCSWQRSTLDSILSQKAHPVKDVIKASLSIKTVLPGNISFAASVFDYGLWSYL
ncbi:MAG: hypothetical protein PWQ17_1346 [Anaerophaga sp.]|nr:hypothetical protein [Anaerophaga sp.]MDK2841841.1 hypothetical protein [Anaerophaga sp.]MDN5291237.1 hypothetical protein [Anaerophaga sp.]